MRGLVTALLVYAAKRPLSRTVHLCFYNIKTRHLTISRMLLTVVACSRVISNGCYVYFFIYASPFLYFNAFFIFTFLSWILYFIGDCPHKTSEFTCKGNNRNIMRFSFSLHVLITLRES